MPILSGLFSLANGIGQAIKGHNMDPVRPDYEIPEETKRALGLRQLLLNSGLPGEQTATENIYTNQGNTLGALARASNDQSQLLSGLGTSQAQTNNALSGLQVAREQSYNQNLAGLERQQENMAAAKDKAFELNEYQPYLMQMMQKYQLQNAGNQNISDGLSGVEAGAADLVTGGLSGFAKLFGGKGDQSPVPSIQGSIGFQPRPVSTLGSSTLANPSWFS